MKITKKFTIDSCIDKCPFFLNSMDGIGCGHPFFDDKKSYENVKIIRNNMKHPIPEKCPLRKENLEIGCTYKVKL